MKTGNAILIVAGAVFTIGGIYLYIIPGITIATVMGLISILLGGIMVIVGFLWN